MNNTETTERVEIIVEREFGKENLTEIYADIVGRKIAKIMFAGEAGAETGESENKEISPVPQIPVR